MRYNLAGIGIQRDQRTLDIARIVPFLLLFRTALLSGQTEMMLALLKHAGQQRLQRDILFRAVDSGIDAQPAPLHDVLAEFFHKYPPNLLIEQGRPVDPVRAQYKTANHRRHGFAASSNLISHLSIKREY